MNSVDYFNTKLLLFFSLLAVAVGVILKGVVLAIFGIIFTLYFAYSYIESRFKDLNQRVENLEIEKKK